ncbi:maleylpyruvate isomerase family mycothiol-dependent enzyme [Nocardioides mesophilus]|uniref:Maleylpyruvate isomerase family mycothiol-dependent enzyme n=1 Tax=Nocardioides mesophilus TaxID=433659 RepID=A0A7G9RET7_9ACTN|nr:maleylpyruvate isomerase family mycothiol-dependent enzyme [Nocardioides mesophilus]QNN54112.1 maleylpyruvate isomerase family mycothiol-dependent enzyme [Nocardioides mesophilus]
MDIEQSSRQSIALPNLVEMVTASTRYLGALSDLTDDDVRAPSLLPGWTRGHVITHLARNADGLCRLLHWAETGEVQFMYDSAEQRDADIEAGAGRSAHDLRVDASASAGRFLQAINELDVRHEDNPVARRPGDASFPAREIPTHRLVELQVHHADLGIGYTPEHWPAGFCDVLLSLVVPDRAAGPSMLLRATDGAGLWQYGEAGDGPTVEGRACDLAWWAIGRGDGSGLTSSSGELPALSRWR